MKYSRCVICQLDYEENDNLVVLSCKHMYHPDCINSWLQINKVLLFSLFMVRV